MIEEPIRLDDYSKRRPDIEGPGLQVWTTELSHLRICYAALDDCAAMDVDACAGERMMLLPDAGVVVQAGHETLHISEASVLVLGAGVQRTQVSGTGRAILISGNAQLEETSKGSSARGVKLFSLKSATRDDSNFRVFR